MLKLLTLWTALCWVWRLFPGGSGGNGSAVLGCLGCNGNKRWFGYSLRRGITCLLFFIILPLGKPLNLYAAAARFHSRQDPSFLIWNYYLAFRWNRRQFTLALRFLLRVTQSCYIQYIHVITAIHLHVYGVSSPRSGDGDRTQPSNLLLGQCQNDFCQSVANRFTGIGNGNAIQNSANVSFPRHCCFPPALTTLPAAT